MIQLNTIRENPDNPRTITDEKFEDLKGSLNDFPKMMELRPLVVDADGMVLGGNMRLLAMKKMGMKEIPDEWVKKADDLTEEEKREFIIKDNLPFGVWDWDILANEWDEELLAKWGMDVPTMKETARLSELNYDALYYDPIETPNIRLKDCVDLEKYHAKMKALDEYDLTEDQKEVLKLFAYRFIKIDFERVANYYAFNATEEEQKAIERLRLVLTDSGVGGFIEDDLLRILDLVGNEIEDDD